jgi:HAD superfamily hydrolase (TIGR01549 family)
MKAIVFDMDGTLFDSAGVVPDAYIDTVVQCGGARYERSDVIAAYALGPPATILSHLLGRLCRDDDVASYHVRLRQLAAGVVVYPGMVEALAELAERVPLAVSTGASAEAAKTLLDAAGLSPFFAVVAGGDEVPQPKPAPDGIRLACARLGIRPSETAYVGDAEVDLEAARRAGSLAVAAGWGHLFCERGHAEHVVHEPRELVALVAGS